MVASTRTSGCQIHEQLLGVRQHAFGVCVSDVGLRRRRAIVCPLRRVQAGQPRDALQVGLQDLERVSLA